MKQKTDKNKVTSRICLIRQFVTFSSVPANFLSFAYISVHLIRHRLIRHLFLSLRSVCSANTSFAASLLMFKQLVRMGIQTKDLYLRIVAPRNLFIEFIHEVRSATRLPIERTWDVFAVC